MAVPTNVGSNIGLNAPVSVSGLGTTAKSFGSTINMQGSNRLNGRQFKIKGSGSATTAGSYTVKVGLLAAYPAGQFPAVNCTSTSLTNNVATYNVANSFTAGQYVTVAGSATAALNLSTATAIATANSTAITISITNANVANAADTNCQISIAPFPVFSSNTATVATTTAPFAFEVNLCGDTTSNLVQGTFQTEINGGVTDGIQALASNASIAQVNFASEPPLIFTPTVTFGTTNANNSAKLYQFVLES